MIPILQRRKQRLRGPQMIQACAIGGGWVLPPNCLPLKPLGASFLRGGSDPLQPSVMLLGRRGGGEKELKSLGSVRRFQNSGLPPVPPQTFAQPTSLRAIP